MLLEGEGGSEPRGTKRHEGSGGGGAKEERLVLVRDSTMVRELQMVSIIIGYR